MTDGPVRLDVSFDGGPSEGGRVRLAGTLVLPAGDGPHPGVVLVGGSGPSDRDNDVLFPPIRDSLVDAGLAVLSYDKRGVGGSSGSWLDSGIAELAADAVAAVGFLRSRAEVAGGSVGLFGHSEGGWVVLRAAGQSGDGDRGTDGADGDGDHDTGGRGTGVAWVVTNSGPGVGPAPQERYALATGARAMGVSEGAVAACVDLFDRIFAAARLDAGFDEVDGLLRADPAYEVFGKFGVELTAPMWRLMKRYADHDPAPDVARLRCPHLALFGGADPIVPVVDSVTAFRRAACHTDDPGTEGGNSGLTVEVFAGADHRVRVDGGTRFAPGYLATLTRWVREHA